jgi:SAM-dependent methyltransferase
MFEFPTLKSVVKKIVPRTIYGPVLAWWRPLKAARWRNLRRLTPVSRVFGLDRGQSIDRYYIERFLQKHTADIRGCVLEIGNSSYTRRFGYQQVTRSEVLHVTSGNPVATVIGNFETGEGVPQGCFDCVILTQTLQVIYDLKAAMVNVYAALRPGGVVLATLSGISQLSRYDMERWGDYWRFTSQSARRLFEEVFPPANVTVEAYGNVFAATAFLYGLASHELRTHELDFRDPDYEVSITVRAVKPRGSHEHTGT